MKKSNKLYDIIVAGPGSVELRGQQQGSSLQHMLSFEKTLGNGAPKVAVGLARLGARCAVISTLGNDEMGKFITEMLHDESVDTSQITTINGTQTSLYLKNNPTDTSQTLTYGNSLTDAISDVNEAFLTKGCALLVLSAWLKEHAIHTNLLTTIKQAKENQVKIILLLDEDVTLAKNLSDLLALCDVIIGRELDYINLVNAQDIDGALLSLRQSSSALLVIKNGQSCYVPSQCHHHGFNIETAKPDISASGVGFIAAWLQEKTLEQCCEQANACEILMSLNSESPSLDALSYFLDHQNQVVARSIQSAFFSNLCYSSVQKRLKKPLFLLNLGDLKLWEKMAEPYNVKEETINLAKQFMNEAIIQGLENHSSIGIIFEDETTFDIKTWSTKLSWMARSLEKPGETPLQFISESELTSTLALWPKHHIAKVSVTYHPDDRYSLRGQQEALLAQLHQVCRFTKHGLLIDLLMPMNSLITAKTHSHIMQRFYELGIYPDYWQMSIPRDQRSWENIYSAIQESAPFCQGLFINAVSAPVPQLPTLMEIAGKEKICQGLVVGRTLFQQTVEQWFAKKIDDRMFVQILSDTFRETANLWYEKCHSESFIDHLMPRSWQIYS